MDQIVQEVVAIVSKAHHHHHKLHCIINSSSTIHEYPKNNNLDAIALVATTGSVRNSSSCE
jgi:hypothetical protein